MKLRGFHTFGICVHIIFLLGLLIALHPQTAALFQKTDIKIFRAFHSLVTENALMQVVFGYLNHRYESSANVIIAVMVNGIGYWVSPRSYRKQLLLLFLYFWACLEIGFLLQHFGIGNGFEINRQSPTVVLPDTVSLSELLQNSKIKDFSYNSFPGDHAFAMIYWCSFNFLCSPRPIAWLGIPLGIFFCLPRIVSGAHWPSDIIFSALLALCWLYWTTLAILYWKPKFLKIFQPLH